MQNKEKKGSKNSANYEALWAVLFTIAAFVGMAIISRYI